MKKLVNIILKKFLTLSILALVIVGAISFYWIKNLYINQAKNELIHYLNLIKIDLNKTTDFNKIVKELKNNTDLRVTIIDNSGNVIADSDAKIKLMYNHLNRDEIIKSNKKEFGYSIRKSKTLNIEFLYVAKKIELSNRIYYLRISKRLDQIRDSFFNFVLKIGFVYIVFLIAFIYIIYKISDEIAEETDKILYFLKDLKKQKNNIQIESNYSLEFNKITKLLTEVANELSQKYKKKAKYTAKLKLANKQKDEIISAISHEFKNPISVISGYAQTLIQTKNLNQAIKDKFLNKIYTNSKRLTSMIDRLRLFIKLEDDNQKIDFKRSNINEIVNDVIDDLKNSFDRKIIFKYNKTVYKNIDPTLFSVAVKNLVENALKYSEDEIVVILNDKSFCVEDRGIGIDKKDIEKITQKFYRVSKNSWNNSLGIGLSIVKHILKLHNFRLEINSIKFKGSKFCIIF